MDKRYTADELNTMASEDLYRIILKQQEQLSHMADNYEKLLEQLRIATQTRFGRRTEKLDAIDGQLSLFDEAEAFSDPTAEEPAVEEVVASYRRRKQKGKREEDLKDLPEEIIPTHSVAKEELDAFYGEGNWKAMPSETYKRVRYEPASWTVEVHTVEVYVGTGGDHQDEFLRGRRPKDLIRNSIVTPSLGSAVLNGKYVLALPFNRIEQEFERGGLAISRQTMANWIISCARYFAPVWERMKQHLLALPVVQADETPTQVIRDGRPAGSHSYMWLHRSGEFCKDKQIVLYEYQKTRHHTHPLEFYGSYSGILVTDALQQYHLVEQKLPGVTNANCWAHARRDLADACKAIGKSNKQALKRSLAHQALELIAKIYVEEGKLRDLSAEERLEQRLVKVRPLVEAYFAWVREQLSSGRSLPKGKTAEGLNYSLNHEAQLKVFLTDGNVPIDNSASERAIRPFCLGKKNWLFFNTVKGAKASAIAYSLAESAKANNLRPYPYFKHLLSELPERRAGQGNIGHSTWDDIMPGAELRPEECYKRR